MAAEKAQLQFVKNDIIRVNLPFIEDSPVTYLTAAASATDTSLTVKDNKGFAQNNYTVIENVGVGQAEIKRITAAVTAGTALTVAALTFSHGNGAKLALIRYDQVELYGSSSASDSAPTLIGSAEGLNVQLGYNEIKATTTYVYYYARYKDSNAGTYSQYSDSVAAAGLGNQSRAEIKTEFLSIYGERIDDLITEDWLNRSVNRWQRELSKRKKTWSVLRAISLTNLVQDQQGYTLPSDIQTDDAVDAIVSVKIADQQETTYIDQGGFLNLTADHVGTVLDAAIGLADTSFTLEDSSDFAAPTSGTASIYIQGDAITYTTNTKSTGVLSGGAAVTATHSTDDEVWQTYTSGQPTHYTIDNGKIRLYPIPNSTWAGKNLHIAYWKKFVDLDDDSDSTLFLYPENCYLYLSYQISIRRSLSLNEQQARKLEWQADLENLVAEDPDFRDIKIQPRDIYKPRY